MKDFKMWFSDATIIASIFSLTFLSFLVKVAGLVKEGLFARTFGVSTEVDHFYFSFLLVNFIATIVSGAIVSTLIPIYFEPKDEESKRELILLGFVFTVVITLIVCSSLYLFVLSSSQSPQFINFLMYFTPVILLSTLTGYFSAILNAKRIFLLPMTVTLLTPLTPLIVLFLNPDVSLDEIARFTTLGFLLTFILICFIYVYSTDGLFLPNRRLLKQSLLGWRGFSKSFLVLLGGFLFLPGIEVISQFIVSQSHPGGVAQLSYGSKITTGIFGVLAVSLGTVLFPEYSRLHANKEFKKIYNYLIGQTIIIFTGLIVASSILAFFSVDVIQIAFLGGRFLEADVHKVASLQVLIFFYIPFFTLISLNSRILSSIRRNVELLYLNLFFLIFHLVITYIWGPRFGLWIIPLLTLVTVFLYWVVSLLTIRFFLKESEPLVEEQMDLHVAFLIHSLAVGGAERQVSQIANGMAEKGHQVTIYVFHGGHPLEKDLVNPKIEIVDLHKLGKWENIFFFIRLVYDVSRKSPDILYSFLTVSNVYSGFLRFFCPSIKVIWGIRNANYDQVTNNFTTWLAFKVERLTSFLPHRIICNSYRAYDEIVSKGYPKERCLVVPNGINIEKFSPSPSLRQQVRKRFGLQDDSLLITMVARWDPVKDHETFFKSILKLRLLHPDFKVLCVGNGLRHYYSHVRNSAKSLGLDDEIIWVDKNSNPREFYVASDILVSTSLSEGFPNVIGEGMASNIFQVVTDVGDSARIVASEGEVFSPRNVDQLVGVLYRVINTKRYLNHYSRRHIKSLYSIDKVNDLNEYVFFDVIREHPQRKMSSNLAST
jgi:peptidoglycan biosynthesis protein MviN/MurJ (putative lipid II flippase)